MKSSYSRLGDFIHKIDVRNKNSQNTKLLGLSMTKEFRPHASNITGTDLSRYKVVDHWQFACDFMSTIRVRKLPVVLQENDEQIIVSPAYTTFEVIDSNELHPEYLMMWFRRSEFDRYAYFCCDSAVRGGFNLDELCDVQLPVPSIDKQREIVKEYNTIVNRIKLNEQLNQKLEETAQAIYKHWFVDFEFPNENGQPYKSSGGQMVYNEALDQEIPEGWCLEQLGTKCTKIGSGSTPRGGKSSYKQSGISLIRSMNVYDFKFKIKDLAHIDNQQADKLKNVEVYERDILFNITGASVARCCIVPSAILPARVNQHVAIIRTEKEMVYFLLCALTSKECKQKILGISDYGSTREAVTKDDLDNFELLFPREIFLKKFDIILNSIFQHKFLLSEELELLKAIKNILLSKISKVESLKTEQAI